MAGTTGQAKAAIKSAQAAIAAGRAETPAGVPQIQKGEIHQVDLRRGCNLKGRSIWPCKPNPPIG
jgi:hypothetical protein